MYDAVEDSYCYPGTSVLKNKLDLREQSRLDAFEAEIVSARADEPIPVGNLGYDHFKAMHKHLFQDVYDWAGEERTVRIAKGESMFCYPENIRVEAIKLFDTIREQDFLAELSASIFAARAAHCLAELNAIHVFEEGNGRVRLVYLTVLADYVGHPLDLDRLDPKAMLTAMIDSFSGEETNLRSSLEILLHVEQGLEPKRDKP